MKTLESKKSSDEIKNLVKEKYGVIAESNTSCCATNGCSTVEYSMVGESYADVKGYNKDADLGLGCGLPTGYAGIQEGDTVVDLGSGAGNDAFVARALVGEKGDVIGIDMTPNMIQKARQNNEKLGYENVHFRLGEIENLPIADNKANVVISNCVMNLVPDKNKAFQETFRILKPGGRFSISDIVLEGELPDNIRNAAQVYAGCIGGALQKKEYLRIIEESGFEQIQIRHERQIEVPADLLRQSLGEEEYKFLAGVDAKILSITVSGKKPKSCCSEEAKCC